MDEPFLCFLNALNTFTEVLTCRTLWKNNDFQCFKRGLKMLDPLLPPFRFLHLTLKHQWRLPQSLQVTEEHLALTASRRRPSLQWKSIYCFWHKRLAAPPGLCPLLSNSQPFSHRSVRCSVTPSPHQQFQRRLLLATSRCVAAGRTPGPLPASLHGD